MHLLKFCLTFGVHFIPRGDFYSAEQAAEQRAARIAARAVVQFAALALRPAAPVLLAAAAAAFAVVAAAIVAIAAPAAAAPAAAVFPVAAIAVLRAHAAATIRAVAVALFRLGYVAATAAVPLTASSLVTAHGFFTSLSFSGKSPCCHSMREDARMTPLNAGFSRAHMCIVPK